MTDDDSPKPSDAPLAAAPPARGFGSPWWLVAFLACSAVLALVTRRQPAAEPEARVSPASPAGPEQALATSAEEDEAIAGKIVERLDVPKYTYLALEGAPGSARTWVAVATSDVNVGQSVRVVNAQRMTNFTSASLARTFETIYFGVLESESHAPPAGYAHGEDPHAGVPGAPALRPGAATNPHGTTSRASEDVVIGKVPRAEGRSGRTVLETHTQRRELLGQKVRVRAVVIKVTEGVLDRNFLRVRDGSEDASVRDLVVTTRAQVAVGDRVLIEGQVATEKDFGAGYVYPVLLEDAAILERENTKSPML